MDKNIRTDDIDGTEGADRYYFTWAGEDREIDLNEKNRAAFDKAMAPFLKVSRKQDLQSGKPRSKGKDERTTQDYVASEVRAWARANNVQVSDKGRVHPDVVAAYRAAQ